MKYYVKKPKCDICKYCSDCEKDIEELGYELKMEL